MMMWRRFGAVGQMWRQILIIRADDNVSMLSSANGLVLTTFPAAPAVTVLFCIGMSSCFTGM
jgi:hypothetical protein